MADQAFRNLDKTSTNSASAGGLEGAASSAKSVADQARSAGRELKNKAAEAADSSVEAIREQAAEFVDAAKGVASDATDKFKETIDGQKTAGAEYVGSLADTLRRAAREFDRDLPIAGTYMRKAATQVETVSDSIRNGDFNDLVRGAQDFARRQPTAFLGLAVLAGFGAVRLLKSSAEATGDAGSNQRSYGGDEIGGRRARNEV
jgi:ElaB/YqjD/DUF883 family membrane-anchored ribosome-binding protein